MAEAEILQKFGNTLNPLRRRQVQGFQNRQQILLHGKLTEDRSFLGQIGNSGPRPLIHRKLSDVEIIEKDLSAVGPDQPHHHIKAGGFTGTIRPEQPDDLPGKEFQVDIAHHLSPAIGFIQAPSVQTADLHFFSP